MSFLLASFVIDPVQSLLVNLASLLSTGYLDFFFCLCLGLSIFAFVSVFFLLIDIHGSEVSEVNKRRSKKTDGHPSSKLTNPSRWFVQLHDTTTTAFPFPIRLNLSVRSAPAFLDFLLPELSECSHKVAQKSLLLCNN